MKTSRKPFSAVTITSLVLAVLMVAASSVAAIGAGETAVPVGKTAIHQKVNINDITDSVPEVPMLTSAASAIAKDKQWYEYVYYSENPVGCYYYSDNVRVTFFDPYDYASSLVMDVEDSITDWSSNNSMQVSYTTGNSLSNSNGNSTETTSTIEKANGKDVSETNTDESTVTTTVEGNVHTYNYSKSGTEHSQTDDDTWTVSEQILGEIEGSVSPAVKLKGGINITNTNNFGLVKTDTYKDDIVSYGGQSFSDYSHGYTRDDTTTIQKSDAGHSTTTTTIADRFSESTGYSSSSNLTLSTDNSTTVTKTYEAGYFNDRGSPLQWKIVKYTVKMPMFYQIEYLVDGEWIFGESNYCLLTTVEGTCRAWLENNVAYYEHWGNGEPVTWDEFWSGFFTPNSLKEAYKNTLYPN